MFSCLSVVSAAQQHRRIHLYLCRSEDCTGMYSHFHPPDTLLTHSMLLFHTKHQIVCRVGHPCCTQLHVCLRFYGKAWTRPWQHLDATCSFFLYAHRYAFCMLCIILVVVHYQDSSDVTLHTSQLGCGCRLLRHAGINSFDVAQVWLFCGGRLDCFRVEALESHNTGCIFSVLCDSHSPFHKPRVPQHCRFQNCMTAFTPARTQLLNMLARTFLRVPSVPGRYAVEVCTNESNPHGAEYYQRGVPSIRAAINVEIATCVYRHH